MKIRDFSIYAGLSLGLLFSAPGLYAQQNDNKPAAAKSSDGQAAEAAATTDSAGQNDDDKNGDDADDLAIKKQLAELKAQVKSLQDAEDEREMQSLRNDAEAAVSAGVEDDDDSLASKVFRGGARSLQRLNPEISVVGDVFVRGLYQNGEMYNGGERTGFFPRVAGLHFQSNLDPFSLVKIAIPVTPGGAEIGEAYVVWNSVTPWMSLTLGKFHQQFGVVNRWHAPSLDQFVYPLVLLEHFGGGPLEATGLSAEFLLPSLWTNHMDLTVQVTNGSNEKLFSGAQFGIPTGLMHLRQYWDLNRDTYLEFGLTGLAGVNNRWGVMMPGTSEAMQIFNGKPDDASRQELHIYDAQGNPVFTNESAPSLSNDIGNWRVTALGGADLTLSWEPLDQAKYTGFTWRSEALYAYKQVAGANGKLAEIRSWGGYSYAQYKFARYWIAGVRGDLTQPMSPANDGKYTWGVEPYITWWQSPWVRFRLQGDYIHWAGKLADDGVTWMDGKPEYRALLQVTFSAGPHKHERY